MTPAPDYYRCPCGMFHRKKVTTTHDIGGLLCPCGRLVPFVERRSAPRKRVTASDDGELQLAD